MHQLSWDEAFGHMQTTEVVTKGSGFGVVNDQLVHGHWVVSQRYWGWLSAGVIVVVAACDSTG